jgi:hypothetical protein
MKVIGFMAGRVNARQQGDLGGNEYDDPNLSKTA